MSVLSSDPMWMLHVGLLALQVSALVLTTGIFVTTMISAYTTLSLVRRTLRDIVRLAGALGVAVEDVAVEGIQARTLK